MLYIAADDALANFAIESLKQLHKSARAPAGPHEQATVVVAAQIALPFDAVQQKPGDAKEGRDDNKRRYVFTKDSGPTLGENLHKFPPAHRELEKCRISRAANETEKEELKGFLKWAYEEHPADHYALILWGHGPELLLQPPAPSAGTGRPNLYLTPEELRDALTARRPIDGGHLDIIGFDACCMSMLEMACELKGLADFMVASQEDVPDLSFPYDGLIDLFRARGHMPVPSLLQEGLNAYISAYQDCICNDNTRMKAVTLSVLDLEGSDPLKEAVRTLANALLDARDDEAVLSALIQARSQSQDFAGGLYVDLYDFCTNLSDQMQKLHGDGRIEDACEVVLSELSKRPLGTPETDGGHTLRSSTAVRKSGGVHKSSPPASIIIADSADDKLHGTSGSRLVRSTARTSPAPEHDDGSANQKRSHGVSIYLPHLTDEQYATVSTPLVKGGSGTRGSKGYTEMLNGAAVEYLMCNRRDLILVTENYYPNLALAHTGWYDFITAVWTSALIKEVPADLDYHYSAQQSWINVCRKTICERTPETRPEPLVELKA